MQQMIMSVSLDSDETAGDWENIVSDATVYYMLYLPLSQYSLRSTECSRDRSVSLVVWWREGGQHGHLSGHKESMSVNKAT